MLRRILIFLGLVIAVLPYLGFPYDWQSIASTSIGLLIVSILMFSRRPRRKETEFPQKEEGRALHVERMEVVERPEMHVERETVIDTERTEGPRDTETTVEKKVTVVRRRRKVQSASSAEFSPNPSLEQISSE
jgi:membrane protein implicated in regulation of membrane protease activity